jgi:hypothetical protein
MCLPRTVVLYAGTPLDTQTAYVRNFLRFLWIEDLEFVYAEGLSMGEASKQAGLEQAQSAIRRLSALEQLAARALSRFSSKGECCEERSSHKHTHAHDTQCGRVVQGRLH